MKIEIPDEKIKCLLWGKSLIEAIEKGKEIHLKIGLNHDDNKDFNIIQFQHPNSYWCDEYEKGLK